MGLLVKCLVVVALGVALGLTATYFAVDRGVEFDAVRAGPWIGWPNTGSRDADPYTRAARARNGDTPLGVTEGLAFFARVDSDGRDLDPRCDYKVGGATPPARFWTLTAMTPRGEPIETLTEKHGFTSSEVARDARGDFTIAVSREARPGNWLPIAPHLPFVLMLRLYDTAVSSTFGTLDGRQMPEVKREGCA